jgi:hypothetical protein
MAKKCTHTHTLSHASATVLNKSVGFPKTNNIQIVMQKKHINTHIKKSAHAHTYKSEYIHTVVSF